MPDQHQNAPITACKQNASAFHVVPLQAASEQEIYWPKFLFLEQFS